MMNMKILNGNKYFERGDIAKYYKTACLSLIDPSILMKKSNHTLNFDPDLLYTLNEDELATIRSGITKLNNTISWEFTSESAIKLTEIENSYQSLRTPASNTLSYNEFKATPYHQRNNDTLLYFENWLLGVGNDILFFIISM